MTTQQPLERPDHGEGAVGVHIREYGDSDDRLQEFRELAQSAGAAMADCITGRQRLPDARYFLGRGKLDEVAEALKYHQADLLLVDHTLSPAQERNLEQFLQCRVLDRSGLILDIFAQRARSHEGKLQVELAQLRHLSTRLVRGWTHLERQKGGIGLRGPGESQLETDRRLLADRIKYLKGRLDKVGKQRHLGRRARERTGLPSVALVGYTNAGKSTLFNVLTGAAVEVKDQLFATLDTTIRTVNLPGVGVCALSDTVGFVQDLPHTLVAAFRATLEETREADLLLHVLDSNYPQRQLRINQVNQVLEEIGAGKIPRIEVYNKIDLGHHQPSVSATEGRDPSVWLSAVSGEGLTLLREQIGRHFGGDYIELEVQFPAHMGKLRSRLFNIGEVRGERFSEQGDTILSIRISRQFLDVLQAEPDVRFLSSTESFA
jgi:GTP-binding protein HflX